MRITFIIIALIIGYSTLYAKDVKMIIHKQDGKTKEYMIKDLENFSFINSDNPPELKIHKHSDEMVANYDTKNIDSLVFSEDHDSFWIFIDDKKEEHLMSVIDSLTFSYIIIETVKICDQVWMTKNLNVTNYNNGDQIYHAQTAEEWIEAGKNGIGAWCYYDNDPKNGENLGKLYNWYAVNDERGLAPKSWHVPTDEEWKVLEMCLGMSQIEADKMNDWRGTNEGSKLASDQAKWINGDIKNSSDFGSSGFDGMPGGYRLYLNGIFDGIVGGPGFRGSWWSSTENNLTKSTGRTISAAYKKVARWIIHKNNGYSVRCVRD